eukprot:2488188-Pyramimonas_sp.AAC.1
MACGPLTAWPPAGIAARRVVRDHPGAEAWPDPHEGQRGLLAHIGGPRAEEEAHRAPAQGERGPVAP